MPSYNGAVVSAWGLCRQLCHGSKNGEHPTAPALTSRIVPHISSCAHMLQALRDLADPAEGVYNATALLDERLKYIIGMLDKYQKVPGGPARVSNYLSAGVPINKQEAEPEQSDATTSGQSVDGADQSDQTIREQLNSLASNAAQFVFPDAAAAQSNGAGEVASIRGSSGAAEADVSKDGKLLLGGQPSSIATELTDFRRQTQNSNNAVSFEGVRRRIAMFITSDDL